jgi:pimeloyl-ACP methyl ester carboxylesterase
MLRHLGAHDARDLLATIEVPTLIITGDKDLFTPVFTARKMNRAIRGSRLVVLTGGSHYTPIEYPGEIQRELLSFLQGVRGFEPKGAEKAVGA